MNDCLWTNKLLYVHVNWAVVIKNLHSQEECFNGCMEIINTRSVNPINQSCSHSCIDFLLLQEVIRAKQKVFFSFLQISINLIHMLTLKYLYTILPLVIINVLHFTYFALRTAFRNRCTLLQWMLTWDLTDITLSECSYSHSRIYKGWVDLYISFLLIEIFITNKCFGHFLSFSSLLFFCTFCLKMTVLMVSQVLKKNAHYEL